MNIAVSGCQNIPPRNWSGFSQSKSTASCGCAIEKRYTATFTAISTRTHFRPSSVLLSGLCLI